MDYVIDPDRLVELISSAGAQVVDVRPQGRRGGGFIPGSRHIPTDELSGEATTLDRDRSVVFYGDADDDVLGLTEAFRAAGFTAYALAGGVGEWERSGRALEGGGAAGDPGGQPPRSSEPSL